MSKMTDRELQTLRNMGNEAESAATEIEALRTYAADLERRLQEAGQREPSAERWGWLRTALADADRLREDCAMVYQVIGAAMLGEPCDYTQNDVARALDNLSAACNGDPRPHEDLLPWPAPSAAAGKERAA